MKEPTTLRLMTGVVNNNNAVIDGITVHIHTEVNMLLHKVMTSITYGGRVIYCRENSFAKHAADQNLSELLPRGSAAQHKQVMQGLVNIWAALPKEISQWVLAREASKPPPKPLDNHEQRALELFELGLAAIRSEPKRALELWREAMKVNPKLKSVQTNIHRLETKLASKF